MNSNFQQWFRKTDVIQSVVLKVHFLHTAQWLSWLERRPVTAKVVGSSPIWVVYLYDKLGILAQLGEHLPYKQRVIGSSPIGPTYY